MLTVITITVIGIGEEHSPNRLDVEDRHDYHGDGNEPGDYSPTRDGSGSSPLYATQRVVPIPLRLIIETKRIFIGHQSHRNR
jgi:hypothetical protein